VSTAPTPDPVDITRLLDPDPERAAEKYVDLLHRLTKFFEWRRCRSAEDLAQETMVRGFVRIRAGADIFTDDPAHFFFGIAQKLLFEDHRALVRDLRSDSIDDLPLASTSDDVASVEARVHLDQALERLPPAERSWLIRYHLGNREKLRQELRLTPEALRVKIHRCRRRLLRLLEAVAVPAATERSNRSST
jgi:DNA-directed RNA polymerase specialized sigma24 family protein